MTLVDKLLKADVKTAEELAVGTFQSHRLAKILGAETETVDVSIREIKSRRVNDIIGYQFDGKGKFDYSKSYDAKLMMCIEGCTDPDLRNKDLQSYFGCSDAKELCEKLFGMEVGALSDAITEVSGFTGNEDTEEEIKNS
jgi:hypothetical protein